jgi:hypothetical protein
VELAADQENAFCDVLLAGLHGRGAAARPHPGSQRRASWSCWRTSSTALGPTWAPSACWTNWAFQGPDTAKGTVR